jgi:DNA-binding NarL/FixJ family response regulator
MRKASGIPQPIELLVGETCRLSCELMITALRRYPQKLSVVAAAVESAEIVNAYATKKPDVCVISWRLKDGSSAGLTVTRQLHAMHETARILLLIDSPEREVVVEAFRAGALGIFSRDESFGELCKGIEKVHSGQISATNEQLQYLVESLAGKAAPGSTPITDAKGATLLTPREQSLVDLVAQGRTNRDISRELNLSEHTVRNYLFRIFNKLGTSNRLELALYAINQKEASSRDQLITQG